MTDYDYEEMEADYGLDTSFGDTTAHSHNQSGLNAFARQNFGAGSPLVPVTVADLKECESPVRGPRGGANFSIAGTAFERLKLMARVVRTVRNEGYHLYEVADPSSDEQEMFTLIDNRNPEAQPQAEGTVLLAVGKLQPYNEKQCMLAFHLAPVQDGENGGKEVELHGMECKVARKYYEKVGLLVCGV